MIEEWKNIPGYGGKYLISNFGKIKICSMKGYKYHRIDITKSGHKCVSLYDSIKKERHTHSLSAVVWDVFGNEPRTGFHVDHINENKNNNRIDNLQLLTMRQNNSKKYINVKTSSIYTGVTKRGKKWVAIIG
ncbi:MAG TPA: hypothetical protein ENI08_03395, partial [Candidatus Dependentiae bacterium]|nr:hypothetical protein [Candidatus Dependentiae bacterium]